MIRKNFKNSYNLHDRKMISENGKKLLHSGIRTGHNTKKEALCYKDWKERRESRRTIGQNDMPMGNLEYEASSNMHLYNKISLYVKMLTN